MKRPIVIASLLAASAVWCCAESTQYLPRELQNVGIDQRLDAQVPLDATFTDETGAQVALGKYFGNKPVLFVPVYYTCPMLCSQILSGMVAGLRPLRLAPGRDFEIVAMSINPSETASDAKAKRDHYSRSYSSRDGTAGWHFLVGSQASITRVTEAIGFHYHWDPVHKMFVHASGIMVLTPEGRVARYFYGVEFEPKDLELGLVEASHNKIGSPVDRVLLFCYHYDPAAGKYSASVLNILRIAAAAALLLFVAGLGLLWKRDLVRSRAETKLMAGR